MTNLPEKAQKLIKKFHLEPLNEEGGYFRETMRSEDRVLIDGVEKELYTTIYYLLTPNQVSLPHSVTSDEIWHFYLGDPVCLRIFADTVKDIILGNEISKNQLPQALVKANEIQAAFSIAKSYGYSLMATTVVPAFDYKDFSLIDISKLEKIYGRKAVEPFR